MSKIFTKWGGVAIDDTQTSLQKTYSSQKISELITPLASKSDWVENEILVRDANWNPKSSWKLLSQYALANHTHDASSMWISTNNFWWFLDSSIDNVQKLADKLDDELVWEYWDSMSKSMYDPAGIEEQLVWETATQTITNKTIDDYTNKIGADHLHKRIKCVEAWGISKWQPVKFSGWNAWENAIEVELANQATDISIGLAHSAMSNWDFWLLTNAGFEENLDTTGYVKWAWTANEWDLLYVDGAWVLTWDRPTTWYVQPIAILIYKHTINWVVMTLATYPLQDADDVRNTPSGNISATTVQGAINELDTEKATISHTHTASDITDFDTEVSANSDVSANTSARHTHSNKAVLDATTASFTTADETKLDGIENWATADQTWAEIKSLYEAEPNTNAYTDAEKSKLSWIEVNANNYSLPTASTTALWGVKVDGSTITIDGSGVISSAGGGWSVTTLDALEVTGTMYTWVISSFRVSQDATLAKFSAYLEVAPTGANFIVTLAVNGTTQATATITASSNSGTTTSFTSTTLSEGDLVEYEITQIGSSVAWADLTIWLNVS